MFVEEAEVGSVSGVGTGAEVVGVAGCAAGSLQSFPAAPLQEVVQESRN